MKILFVCKGNIVRSFAAERMLTKALQEKSRCDVDVSSAGIDDLNGASADPLAVQILHEMGFDAGDHFSRQLTEDIAAESDMILVMEQNQKEHIIENYPEADGKIFLLRPFSENAPRPHAAGSTEIRDPYGQSSYQYRLRFSEIYMAVQALVEKCI